MNSTRWFAVLMVAGATLGAARADSINVVGSGGAYSSFPSPIGASGSPYWNGASWDYANATVGHYLTGTGAFTGGLLGSPQIAAADLQQFVKAGDTADTALTFSTAALNVSTKLFVTIAGNAATNIFGWYDENGLHPLFGGPNSAVFTPASGWFGLYLKTASNGTFYSQSSLNVGSGGGPLGTSDQHFAVFKQTSNGKLWIGVEDLQLGNSDRDYNDVVISLEAVTPEPASIATFCLGGLVLGGYRLTRRRREQ